ncbi:MAG: transcription-repair coupling factor [Leptospirales bacterium]
MKEHEIKNEPSKQMQELMNSFRTDPALQPLKSDARSFSGVHRFIVPFLLTEIYNNTILSENPEDVLVVLPTDKDVTVITEQLEYLLSIKPESASAKPKTTIKYRDVLPFPTWGILPYTYSMPEPDREGARATTLASIVDRKQRVFTITSIDALFQKIPSPVYYQGGALELQAGGFYSIETITEFLATHGYESVDIVEAPGEFCKKGGILEIFSRDYFDPVRLDFFGDDLESIDMFDPETQRSYKNFLQVSFSGNRDLVLTPDIHEKIGKAAQKMVGSNAPILRTGAKDRRGLWDIYPDLYETASLLDFFEKPPRLYAWDYDKIISRSERIFGEYELLKEKKADENTIEISRFIFDLEWIQEHLKKDAILLNPLAKEKDEHNLRMPEPPHFKGRISDFASRLNSPDYAGKAIFISSGSNSQKERLEHILESYCDDSTNIKLLVSPFSGGFSWQGGILFTDAEIFGKRTRTIRIQKGKTKVVESLTDLSTGDNVVHINYGIGRFVALKRMKVAGNERDFLELEFAGSDKLYVPLEQLNLVHKYIGSSENPRLDYLGNKSTWTKTKLKASEAIEKIALELLEIYARRENSRGISFPPDSRFQEEFEAAFPYEETDGQLSTLLDVKKDMESERPMDRLVCGDVGYGKTEIAIRAAFKAVMAGKQVALLCPTTVLAYQHYNTFSKRFQDYPVSVDFLSRFKSKGEATELKELTKVGKVDIVIGTHALLSGDIAWKDLGLLVVDEEQRFGVKHKESIKKLRANVDCVTLTATPIPRTLQLSMTGIRDLSLIETPPRNRRKIDTHVLEDNEEVLKAAILQELDRSGQVFILHNRVKTIYAQAERIQSLAPGAQVAVLHGQMPDHEIEEKMLEFYRQRYDILVSTTIIESGIDIPNANTLIVMNAHTFGLSQLYQIKGRVGRSDRQAFAYFFYPPGIVMNEIAQKRLNTLMEYDGLGAGFKIAMRDLEIRGAGNILGKEQSGDIMTIGFELYIRMLQDKLGELRDEEKADDFQCIVSIPADFYFPDDYIASIRQKMEFYKKMAAAHTIDEIDDISDQMKDRFGAPPVSVASMIESEKIRTLGKYLKIEKVVMDDNTFSLYASPQTSVGMEKLAGLIQNDNRFYLDPVDPKKIEFSPVSKNIDSRLKELTGMLRYLI